MSTPSFPCAKASRACGSSADVDANVTDREHAAAGAPVRAVVFAYHSVGARCLRVLRAHGAIVPLVVTHADDNLLQLDVYTKDLLQEQRGQQR